MADRGAVYSGEQGPIVSGKECVEGLTISATRRRARNDVNGILGSRRSQTLLRAFAAIDENRAGM